MQSNSLVETLCLKAKGRVSVAEGNGWGGLVVSTLKMAQGHVCTTSLACVCSSRSAAQEGTHVPVGPQHRWEQSPLLAPMGPEQELREGGGCGQASKPHHGLSLGPVQLCLLV